MQAFDAVHWHPTVVDDNCSVVFSYHSADGEEGYPGDVNVFAKFTLDDGGSLHIEYSATSTKKTPMNMVNHMYYFNRSKNRHIETIRSLTHKLGNNISSSV